MSPGTAALSGTGHGGGALAATRRWAAMLVLPASILPVVFLGPTLLRAPHKLWRQASAELQRLEAPGHARGVSASGRATATRGASRPKADRSRAAGRAAASASTPRAARATAGPGDGLARSARRAPALDRARRGERGRPR
jgi:hypothetical protein